jgi:putative ABC transport system permease protein
MRLSIFDIDNWQEIMSSLKKNKVRTFFTAFGVFWGIFMLVIMIGSGNGLKNGVMDDFGDFATNSFFMWTKKTSMPYKGFNRGRRFNFHNDDIKFLKDNVSEIGVLAPRLQGGGYRGASNVVRGKETGAFNIYGDTPEFNKINPFTIVEGRFLNRKDITDKRKVAVIGSSVVDILFKPGEDPLGEYIRIQGVYFKVVGVVRSRQKGNEAERDENSIFLPFTTMQKTFNYGDLIGWFAITSREDVPASVAEEKTIKVMKQKYKIHPDDDRAIGHFNVEKEFKKMTGLFAGINMLIWIVGAGTLLAGAIGVSNIMLIIIKERTKEIGVKRALGATPAEIVTQIILESVFLTGIAGMIGMTIGVAILTGINYLMVSNNMQIDMFLHPEINFKTALTALIILVITGIFAGMIPAYKAIKVKPVEALRDE